MNPHINLNNADNYRKQSQAMARTDHRKASAKPALQVRVEIAKGDGIEVVVCLIQKFECEAGLLCNACLCLMSLVRGEGPACEVNFLYPSVPAAGIFSS